MADKTSVDEGSFTHAKVVRRQHRDVLGEGPIWSSKRNAILWVDILGQQVHCLSLQSDEVSSWAIPEPIGWIIERAEREDFIIGLKGGFATLSLGPFRITHIGNPEIDRPQNRLNDSKTDFAGSIWAGTMPCNEQESSGALYRLDPGFTWSRQDDGYQVTNGPAFSPDGKVMYHADSGSRTVFRFDLTESRNLTAKRVFLKFEDDWGCPDGMTTDVEGGIWIAHWGGGRVSRFLPDGTLERSIPFPQPTSPAWSSLVLDLNACLSLQLPWVPRRSPRQAHFLKSIQALAECTFCRSLDNCGEVEVPVRKQTLKKLEGSEPARVY